MNFSVNYRNKYFVTTHDILAMMWRQELQHGDDENQERERDADIKKGSPKSFHSIQMSN